MPSLNKVMLIGNLTRDPEVTYTPKGTAIAQLGLAINRQYKTDQGEKREEVTFVDVELWGKLAELAGEYLKKGRPVYIEGRLKLETWDDKQTGQKRSKMKVVGEQMQFLGSREKSQDGDESEREYRRPLSAASLGGKPATEPDPMLDGNDPDSDDVPF